MVPGPLALYGQGRYGAALAVQGLAVFQPQDIVGGVQKLLVLGGELPFADFPESLGPGGGKGQTAP